MSEWKDSMRSVRTTQWKMTKGNIIYYINLFGTETPRYVLGALNTDSEERIFMSSFDNLEDAKKAVK